MHVVYTNSAFKLIRFLLILPMTMHDCITCQIKC